MENKIDKKEELSKEEIEALKEQSKEAEKKITEKKPVEPKMYSKEQVDSMFADFKRELAKENSATEDDEIDPKRKITVRIPRFDKKFILGFKNLNTDPYYPDKVVHSQDIFNEQTKQFVPHVTFIFDDESTITMPFETMLKVSDKNTACEVLERMEEDTSEKYGTLEVKEMKGDGYNETATGSFVKGRSKSSRSTFKIVLPDGREVIAQPEVVNW